MYTIVTHKEAKKYKDYLLTGVSSIASQKTIVYNTKINLEGKLFSLLENKEFFDENFILKAEILDIYQDLKIKILKCELLLLGIKSLPLFLETPKFKKINQKFNLSGFIMRMLQVKEQEEEQSLANSLASNYPSKTFWSNMFLDPNFKVNSLNWFLSKDGQIFLKQHANKQLDTTQYASL